MDGKEVRKRGEREGRGTQRVREKIERGVNRRGERGRVLERE